MKKNFWIILIATAIIMTPKSSSAFLAQAIEEAYNVIPISPVVNFGEDIAETGKLLNKTYARAKALANQVKKDATSLKASISSFLSTISLDFLLNNASNENDMTCGSVFGEIDVSRMSKKMREIILSYDRGQKEAVEQQRHSFYLENVYNIYAAVQVMKSELEEDGTVGAKIISAKQCCSEGAGDACGIPSTTEGGNNEMVHTYGYALATLEELVKMWEKVAALKAQMKALEVIKTLEIQPQLKSDKTEQVSYLDDYSNGLAQGIYKISSSAPLGYAQMIYKSSESSLEKVEQESKINSKNKKKTKKEGRFATPTLNFSTPSDPQQESPALANTSKVEAFNELAEVENAVSDAIDLHNGIKNIDSYLNTAKQYLEMKATYQKKLNLLNESNQCGLNYVSRYFSSPAKTWSGIALNISNVNDYDLRKGISGWAVNAYEVAKGAETTVSEDANGNPEYSDSSATQVDDLESETLSDEETSDVNKGADLDEAEAKVDSNKDAYGEGEGVSASASEETQEESRRSSMLSWQIGAEASKSLSSDALSWGTPNGKKMIWNDTKIFYNQYLKRKYNNIKSYLKRYTRDDVIDVFISLLSSDNENGPINFSQTSYQTELNARYAAADAALAALTGSGGDGAATGADPILLQQKENLKNQIDVLSAQAKELSDRISDLSSNAEEKAFDDMDEAASKSVNYLDSNTPKPAIQKYNETSSEMSSRSAQNKEGSDISTLQNQLDQIKTNRDNLQKSLDALELQIEASKIERQEALVSTPSALNQNIANIVSGFVSGGQSAFNQYHSSVDSRMNTALAAIFEDNAAQATELKGLITQAAESVIEEIMGSIDSIVDNAYNQIKALGDDLYLPTSSTQVASIHQNMINALKALSITKSVAGYSLTNMLVFADLATLDVSAETEGFFVGALPRARDLKAPYPMTDLSQPPVREVFHFDGVDFANVKPFNKNKYKTYLNKKSKLKNPLVSDKDAIREEMRKIRSLSKGDFLNYGGEIPAIWRMMLQDNAFIESQFKLNSALTQGCEAAAFLRGGIMPCRVGNTGIVLDVNVVKEYDEDTEEYYYTYDNDDDQYIKRTDLNAQNLPKCLLIDIEDNKPHHSFYDAKVQLKSGLFGNNDEHAEVGCPYSELGMLLDADDNNNLSFKETVYEVFNDTYMVDSDDPSKHEKNQLSMAQQASLSRNQIGDFLKQAEAEKKIHQNLDEMKQKNDDQTAELREKLAEYGYTLSDDYDITRKSDYDLTITRLKQSKAQALTKAMNLLSQVSISEDNEPANNRKETIIKLISIMQKDVDADLELSMSSADENDLDEELKRVKADKEATGRYKNKVDEKKKDSGDYKDLEEAYCANY